MQIYSAVSTASVNDPTVGGVKSNLIDIRQVPILIVLNFKDTNLWSWGRSICSVLLQAPSNAAGLAESEKNVELLLVKEILVFVNEDNSFIFDVRFLEHYNI